MAADEAGALPAANGGSAAAPALRTVRLASAVDFAGFRRACRVLWAEQVTPEHFALYVTWRVVIVVIEPAFADRQDARMRG